MANPPSNGIPNIDINSPDFYEQVQIEIETDLARMRKSVEVILNLRITAAELEVETAALYHAELWYDLLDVHEEPQPQVMSEDEEETDCLETSESMAT